jgi:hypothetical protein
VTRNRAGPLRQNGQPYNGVNVPEPWAAADIAGYSCPTGLASKRFSNPGRRRVEVSDTPVESAARRAVDVRPTFS